MTSDIRQPPRSRISAVDLAAVCESDGQAAAMLAVIHARAARWTQQSMVCEPDEPVDWWHVCWERLGDVAFSQACSPNFERAAWLRDEVLRICELDAGQWIGPFFRPRADPLVGSIETAHIGLAITDVLELCPDLFSAQELSKVHEALIEKGLLPTRRWLDEFDGVSEQFNNHYAVHLNGLVAMAMATQSVGQLADLSQWLEVSASLFQKDSYAESVQYWGYAALHHSHLFELLRHTALVDISWLGLAANALPWVAHSMMFEQRASAWGEDKHFSFLNFSDSALTGRPPSDALLCFARYLKDQDPEGAGLARWLFETTYADLQIAPEDLSSFGFFNQIGWRSVAHIADAVTPISPLKADLPLRASFTFGPTVERDRWDDPLTVLAVRNGHDTLSTVSHRHRDEGSFILGHRGEIFFTDPGHCTYRLQAYRDAKDSSVHSTWTFFDTGGRSIRQTDDLGAAPLGNRHLPAELPGGSVDEIHVYGADISEAYGNPITRAQRTWVTWLPHLVIIVDDIEASEPISVETQFLLNNRDNRLQSTDLSNSRLRLTRGNAAIELERWAEHTDETSSFATVSRRWTALHDVYSPHPNQPDQGKEGSGIVHSFTTATPGRKHRAVHTLLADHVDGIDQWRIDASGERVVHIQTPEGIRRAIPLTFAQD